MALTLSVQGKLQAFDITIGAENLPEMVFVHILGQFLDHDLWKYEIRKRNLLMNANGSTNCKIK